MNYIKVTKKWFEWFRINTVEVVTTIDNREMFETSIKGEIIDNKLNYETILMLIDAFKNAFQWLELKEIRLEYSEKLDFESIQVFKNGNKFDNWKLRVIEMVGKNQPLKDEFEDSTYVHYNYNVSFEDTNSPLYLSSSDCAYIMLWYNEISNITTYKIVLELRKCLFIIDNQFEVNLTQDCLKYNNSVLKESIDKVSYLINSDTIN